MNQVEAIKAAMKYMKRTQKDVAEQIGVAQPTMTRYFNVSGGRMNMNTLCKILDAIGYEIVLQPKNSKGRRQDGAFAIEYDKDGAGK